jgi:hypothetical protein
MGLDRHFLVVVALYGGILSTLALVLVPVPDDTFFLSEPEQRDHALRFLPRASMLQAADACRPGHFHYDETYGYWVQDFQMLTASAAAAQSFASLAARPEVMAQAYGLIGLYLTDTTAFARAFAHWSPQDTVVTVAEGCQWQERPLSRVRDEIGSGYWAREMTKQPVDVH